MRRTKLLNKNEIMRILGVKNEPTLQELECINERQFKFFRPIAITTGICKYNFPQVLVQYPINIKENTAVTGMIRLTCPHLVKEIDKYEREGGVERFNLEIQTNIKEQEDFLNAHQEWKKIKELSMTEEEVQFVHQRFKNRADDFLSSGFLGITMGK